MIAGTVNRCGMYRHGHNVHVIQARLAMKQNTSGQLTSKVTVDGWRIEVAAGGRSIRYWNHRPQLVDAALNYAIGTPEMLPHGVLAIPQPAGWATFSLSETPTSCSGSGAFDVDLVLASALPELAMRGRVATGRY